MDNARAGASAGWKVPAKPRFWDNLIPLRPSLSGIQLAGWQPGPSSMSGLGCRLLADQRIPVDEAVALAADVYLPKPPGRFPAVVVFGAYSKELDTAGVPVGTNEIGCPPVFTDRGYVHAVVTRRCMGLSEGEAGVFFNDQDVDDHERVIAWAAAQPWCDGNVVMFGTSYYGMVQPQVAVRRPPALRAFFCNEICTDYFRHGYVHFDLQVPPYLSRNTLHYGPDTYLELRKVPRSGGPPAPPQDPN